MPVIEVGIDPSRQAEAGYLQGVLMETSFGSLAELFGDPARMVARTREAIAELTAQPDVPALQRTLIEAMFASMQRLFESLADEPDAPSTGFGLDAITFTPVVRELSGPINAYEISFPSAILWGLMGCAAAFALTLVRERTTGTLLRLLTAPLTRAQVLLGKALACYLACLFVVMVLLAFSALCFGVRVTSPLNFVLALLCTSWCFVGLMMLLSVIGRTEQAVSGGGWGILVLLAMLGGGMVPLIAMPRWMLALSDVSPVKWGILSLEGAIWRGFSPAEMLLPCGVLLGIGSAGFALGAWLLTRER